ncbi:MAG: hypothetical protein Q4G03_09090 [Planctomycetia bacterium]|nr:hypothetical protein [Planctomycetia bacterium]
MAQKLIYTSVPQGLYPQTLGFCTVARSRAMNAQTAAMLESLSGYSRVSPDDKPIVYSHIVVGSGAQAMRILSRIQDYGLDYSNRTNHLAVHLVLPLRIALREDPASSSDFILAGPGAVFDQKTLVGYNPQTETRKWFEEEFYIAEPRQKFAQIGAYWQALPRQLGWSASQRVDLGWLGLLASTVNTGKTALVVLPKGVDALPLFQDALAFMRAQDRWNVTFTTLYSNLPNNAICQWKGVRKGSKEELALRRFCDVVIDLEQINRPVEEVYKNLNVHSTDRAKFLPGDCIDFARKRMAMTEWQKSRDSNVDSLIYDVQSAQNPWGAPNQKTVESSTFASFQTDLLFTESESEPNPDIFYSVLDDNEDQKAQLLGAKLAKKIDRSNDFLDLGTYGNQAHEVDNAPEVDNIGVQGGNAGLDDVDGEPAHIKLTPLHLGIIITAVLCILCFIIVDAVILPKAKSFFGSSKPSGEQTIAMKQAEQASTAQPVTEDTTEKPEETVNEAESPEGVPSDGDTSDTTTELKHDAPVGEGESGSDDQENDSESEGETETDEQGDSDNTEGEERQTPTKDKPELTTEELADVIKRFVEIANSPEHALTFSPISKASEKKDGYYTANANVTPEFTEELKLMCDAFEKAGKHCALKFRFKGEKFSAGSIEGSLVWDDVSHGESLEFDKSVGDFKALVRYDSGKFDIQLQMPEIESLNALIMTSQLSLAVISYGDEQPDKGEEYLPKEQEQDEPILKPVIQEAEFKKSFEIDMDVSLQSYIDVLFDHKDDVIVKREEDGTNWVVTNPKSKTEGLLDFYVFEDVEKSLENNDADVTNSKNRRGTQRLVRIGTLNLDRTKKDGSTILRFRSRRDAKEFTALLEQNPEITLSFAVPVPSSGRAITILILKCKAPHEQE